MACLVKASFGFVIKVLLKLVSSAEFGGNRDDYYDVAQENPERQAAMLVARRWKEQGHPKQRTSSTQAQEYQCICEHLAVQQKKKANTDEQQQARIKGRSTK